MSLVLDSSVLVAALADTGEVGRWAEELLERESVVGPELLLVETTNVLRRLEAQRLLTTAEASSALDDLLAREFELYPFSPFARRVWELRGAVSSYDAWYVSMAELLQLPLATLDGALTRAQGIRCTFVTPSGA